MNEMLKQFNLPSYIDGLSFSDASKKIQNRFKDRSDQESIATEKEMLGRLRNMQEHVKKQQEQNEQSELNKNRDPNAIIAGEQNPEDEIQDELMENANTDDPSQNIMDQEQNAYGGDINKNFAPTVNSTDVPIEDSLMSIAGSFGGGNKKESNKFWSGGYEDDYSDMFNNNNPNTQVQNTAQTQQPQQAQQTQGNMMSSIVGGSGSGSTGAGVAGYAAMAGTAVDLGKQAFGPTGVDTTGAVRVKPVKAGNAALAGAAKGATAGAVLGPWGAAAGAVVGAAAGYLGGKKQQKADIIANRNATYADASKNDNQFELGGYENESLMNEILIDPSRKNQYNTKNIVKYQPGVTDGKTGKSGYYLYSKDPSEKGFNVLSDREFAENNSMVELQKTPQWQQYMKNNQNQHAKGGKIPRPKPNQELSYQSIMNNYDPLSSVNLPIMKENEVVPTQTQAVFEEYYKNNNPLVKSTFASRTKDDVLNAGKKVYDFASENTDALRYAPALSNVLQLANLKKPDQETTRELSNRYEQQLTDENALTNLVREETNSNRDAILNASNGSESAVRANLLGSQLNSTKALSDAYLKSAEINANEARQEQSFNLGVDQVNIGQSNLAQDIRARNKGVYESEKSKLQSAVATDLGSIGQEELYKKFPELLGMDYNWKGKYQKLKEDNEKSKSKK